MRIYYDELITMKKALITGITGQDGSYLAEFLLHKGHEVHGIKSRSSLINTDRIDHLYQDPHEQDLKFILHHGDLTDATSLIRIIQEVQPDEIYNLAAQSHVAVSFEEPEYTANSDALGALISYLSALRQKYNKILNVITVIPGYMKTRRFNTKANSFIVSSPVEAANIICEAIVRKKEIVYIDYKWKLIMSFIKIIPEILFKKLNF